jgi:hypothetical protein
VYVGQGDPIFPWVASSLVVCTLVESNAKDTLQGKRQQYNLELNKFCMAKGAGSECAVVGPSTMETTFFKLASPLQRNGCPGNVVADELTSQSVFKKSLLWSSLA